MGGDRSAVVTTLSGGLDSAVLAYWLAATGNRVHAISFDYGQRHRVELSYAKNLASLLGVPWRRVDLRGVCSLLAGSSQTSVEVEVPRGHYTDASMKATVVPNRNMVMLSIAAGWAVSLKAEALAYAAHAGDHPIYPDCRPEFVHSLQVALYAGNDHRVELLAPFVRMTKAQIVAKGRELGVPFEHTWSCYDPQPALALLPGRVPGYAHCGCCGTCVERREAFALAEVADPTVYAPAGVAS
jgi:7-cyano-7-deazaguanine synthase